MDSFNFGLTVEFEGQQENVIAKFELLQNAITLANYAMNNMARNPIVRVVDFDAKECLHSWQREFKELDKETSVF